MLTNYLILWQKFIKMRLFQVMVLCALICALPVESWGQLFSSASDELGFALLVDVSDYRDADIPPLREKSREVEKIKNALHSVGGFPEPQIRVVTGIKATRDGITEALTAIVERTKMRRHDDTHFLFYFKGRSLNVQGKKFFLPYDARVGATSSYIEETTLMNWFNRVPLKMKALIMATWDVDTADDKPFSTQLAEVLRKEKIDSDANRNVTLLEIETKIHELGFHGDAPVRIAGDRATVLLILPSVLDVSSQPPGATVLLNGTEKGVTPARIVVTPGVYEVLVKKELYRTAGWSHHLNVARGGQSSLSAGQLKPIRVYGTTEYADKEVVAGVQVGIAGTGYWQTVDKEGKFSFENWQTYGLLESGKTYDMLAKSPDDLYTGRLSFTFSGTEDIRLTIPLKQMNWIELVEQRLKAGDRAGAMATFDMKLPNFGQKGDGTLNKITPALALEFLTHLETKLQAEPDNLQWHVVAARLADLTSDVSAAKKHWMAIKAKASKESNEYKQADARLKELSPNRMGLFLLLVAVGVVVLGAVGFFIYRQQRIGEYREIPNPYIAGKPISEEEMFFGREDVFNFVKDKFSRSAKDITIVLHGGRRTGKTSILYQIANGRLGEEFVPIFIDMQEMAGVDAHDFFRRIAQKVSEVYRRLAGMSDVEETRMDDLCGALEDKTKPVSESFNDFLTHVTSTLEGKYLIFLIDEYEIIDRKVNEGDLSDEIFSYLRHLMQNMSNLAFIFSGSSHFAGQKRKEWALTFNMAQPREVSFLSQDDAIALITNPVKDFVRYDRKAVDLVLRLTAGQPFFTQAVCQYIIEYLNDREQNRVTTEQVDEAYRDIVENAPYHFAYIWGELTDDEKITIALLAESLPDETAYASVDDIASKLANYDLQYTRADISKNLARLLEEHLIETKPGTQTEAYRFRMDLTRGWLQAEHPTWGVLKEVQDNNE